MFSNLKNIYNKIEKEKLIFFYGEEDFFLNHIEDYIKQYFANDILYIEYGETLDLKKLYDQILQETLFTSRKVFIIKNLQKFKELSWKENLQLLSNIFGNKSSDNILIFFYNDKIGKTSSIVDIFKTCFIYESKKLSENQTKNFIKDVASKYKIDIKDNAINLLYDYYGNDLQKIHTFLSQYRNNSVLDCNFITQNIKYSKEFNSFHFLSAIGNKNFALALKMIECFNEKNDFEIIPLIGLLYSFFSKVLIIQNSSGPESEIPNTFFYKNAARLYSIEDIFKIMESLLLCDETAKGINALPKKPHDILKILICSCMKDNLNLNKNI